MNTMCKLASAICLLLVILIPGRADDWPQWRGPEANGTALAGDYPVHFTPRSGLLWKSALPGRGTSTPAVWKNSIILTCTIDGRDGALCFDRQGTERWRTTLGTARKARHQAGSACNPSPVTDGKRIFVYYNSRTLAALDFTGGLCWHVNLEETYGKRGLKFSLGTSPILHGDSVVIAVVEGDDSYVLALHKETGNEIWRSQRPLDFLAESGHSYASPLICMATDNTPALLVWGADHLTTHDLDSGRIVWTCSGFNPDEESNWRTIASPTVVGDIAVVCYGRGRRIGAVRLRSRGVTEREDWLWRRAGIGADAPTPVSGKGRVFILSDSGKLRCLDVATGRDIWQTALPRTGGRFYASPTLAGDILYCVSERGMVFVGRVSENFELLAQNDLQDEVIASPVAVDNLLLIRGSRFLFCAGKQ